MAEGCISWSLLPGALCGLRDINNPKIPLQFVISNGELLYTDEKHLDLSQASSKELRAPRPLETAERPKLTPGGNSPSLLMSRPRTIPSGGPIAIQAPDTVHVVSVRHTFRGSDDPFSSTPCEAGCRAWTSKSDRFTSDPIHKMPGLNTKSGRPPAGTRRDQRLTRRLFCHCDRKKSVKRAVSTPASLGIQPFGRGPSPGRKEDRSLYVWRRCRID